MTEEPAPVGAGPAGQGTRPGYGDLVAGSLAVVFGATVLVYIRGFPQLPGGQPGPALFPGIIAGLFVLFGGILVVRWFAQRRADVGAVVEGPEQPEQPERPTTKAWLTALAMCAAVVVYLLVVDLLGFTLTMSVLLFALMKVLGTRTLLAALASVTTAVVVMLLFQMVLLVPLPTGILG
ncbi:MAG TPA: tripartite tricarboxylate transporter TctB family protein [Nocardioidaceae bacterium]|nr:tripartite tricarboxylate transporter TctB family protein [Nocardioidaceae bacterium]